MEKELLITLRSGTGFVTEVSTTYERLVGLFGEPHLVEEEASFDGKIHAEWVVPTIYGVVSVYDYKQYDKVVTDVVHWHIGVKPGDEQACAVVLEQILTQKLTRAEWDRILIPEKAVASILRAVQLSKYSFLESEDVDLSFFDVAIQSLLDDGSIEQTVDGLLKVSAAETARHFAEASERYKEQIDSEYCSNCGSLLLQDIDVCIGCELILASTRDTDPGIVVETGFDRTIAEGLNTGEG